MKYLIWGAGIRGKRYSRYIEDDDFIAFVDKDPSKIGTTYCGKMVISFEEYQKKYTGTFLILGMAEEIKPVRELEKRGIFNYLLFSECPSEYREYDRHTLLQDYITSHIIKDVDYLIYGSNLFTIQLHELIYKHTGKRVPVMLNKNLHKMREDAFIETVNKEVRVMKYNDNVKADYILATCEDCLDELQEIAGNLCKVVNLFDCSGHIEAYHNRCIEKYRNAHKNESCFIVATGPSLRVEDLDLINQNKITTLSMNSIWKAFPMTKWRPTYYMAEDPNTYTVEDKEFFEMEKTGIEMMFLGDTNDEYWRFNEPKSEYLRYHACFVGSETQHPKFSEDPSYRVYSSGTITYSCIQMAVYMGFKKIYLLGVDFSSRPEKHKYGHFYPEKNGYTSILIYDVVRLGYEMARKYTDENGIQIYNATRGGCLEIFDRVDFDSLFLDGKFTPENGFVQHRNPWYR